jgi:hypothetical protein
MVPSCEDTELIFRLRERGGLACETVASHIEMAHADPDKLVAALRELEDLADIPQTVEQYLERLRDSAHRLLAPDAPSS